ncbi:MAG: hypothetical protein WKG07_22580 [Hymenobacter sp.]
MKVVSGCDAESLDNRGQSVRAGGGCAACTAPAASGWQRPPRLSKTRSATSTSR